MHVGFARSALVAQPVQTVSNLCRPSIRQGASGFDKHTLAHADLAFGIEGRCDAELSHSC